MSPDVRGILAALSRLPGTTREQRARYSTSREALTAASALRSGRRPSSSGAERYDRSQRAKRQARDAGGRFV